MRVLHVIPALSKYNGGTTEAVIGLCRAVEGEVLTDIATSEEKLDAEQHRLLRERLGKTDIYTFPCYGAGTRMLSAPFLRWLHENIRRYDIVHTHTLLSPMTTAFMSFCHLTHTPYVLSPHGMLSPYTFLHSFRLLKKVYFTLIDRYLIERASTIHCATPQEAEKASRWNLRPPVVVIPLPYCQTYAARDLEREDNPGERIVFLSRLVRNKGLDLLLPAFQKALRQVGRRVQLIIAGKGDEAAYEDELHSRVRRLELEENVSFLGFVQGDDKEQVLRKATIFVLPSREENFSFAVVEAMDVGIPVVISEDVGLASYVSKYRAGLVVQRSIDCVSAALVTLLENPALRQEMGRNGQRLIQERLRPELVGSQLVELYRNAARVSPASNAC